MSWLARSLYSRLGVLWGFLIVRILYFPNYSSLHSVHQVTRSNSLPFFEELVSSHSFLCRKYSVFWAELTAIQSFCSMKWFNCREKITHIRVTNEYWFYIVLLVIIIGANSYNIHGRSLTNIGWIKKELYKKKLRIICDIWWFQESIWGVGILQKFRTSLN